jgi:hypothetical protein
MQRAGLLAKPDPPPEAKEVVRLDDPQRIDAAGPSTGRRRIELAGFVGWVPDEPQSR